MVPPAAGEWADARVTRLTDVAAPAAPALRLTVLVSAAALVAVPTLMLLSPVVR
jgi:hypothetical protein